MTESYSPEKLIRRLSMSWTAVGLAPELVRRCAAARILVAAIRALNLAAIGALTLGLLFAKEWTLGAPLWFKVAPLACMLLWMFAIPRARRKCRDELYAFALEANGAVCTHCGYALAGLPEQHHCPECGIEYDLPRLRQRWLDWASSGYPPW